MGIKVDRQETAGQNVIEDFRQDEGHAVGNRLPCRPPTRAASHHFSSDAGDPAQEDAGHHDGGGPCPILPMLCDWPGWLIPIPFALASAGVEKKPRRPVRVDMSLLPDLHAIFKGQSYLVQANCKWIGVIIQTAVGKNRKTGWALAYFSQVALYIGDDVVIAVI